MARYKHKGVGGALGILGFAIIGNHIGLIALILLLCWLPWWIYLIAGIIISTWMLVDYFTKQGDKDGIK